MPAVSGWPAAQVELRAAVELLQVVVDLRRAGEVLALLEVLGRLLEQAGLEADLAGLAELPLARGLRRRALRLAHELARHRGGAACRRRLLPPRPCRPRRAAHRQEEQHRADAGEAEADRRAGEALLEARGRSCRRGARAASRRRAREVERARASGATAAAMPKPPTARRGRAEDAGKRDGAIMSALHGRTGPPSSAVSAGRRPRVEFPRGAGPPTMPRVPGPCLRACVRPRVPGGRARGPSRRPRAAPARRPSRRQTLARPRPAPRGVRGRRSGESARRASSWSPSTARRPTSAAT